MVAAARRERRSASGARGHGRKCPNCGSELVAKTGFGPFVGCSNYPECKSIKKEPPKESRGLSGLWVALVEKRGRFGPFGLLEVPRVQVHQEEPKAAASEERFAPLRNG